MELFFTSTDSTQAFGELLGRHLQGGEVFELVGDVGSGKTTFVKGLAKGLGVNDDVQSPSFTISRTYTARDGLELHHYDFYRLPDPGIMAYDLAESTQDSRVVTVIEWAETVADVLPDTRSTLHFAYGENDNDRLVTIQSKVTSVGEAYAAWNQN